jgi:hypothetical protein
VLGPVTAIAMLPILPEKQLHPKSGAYPKYGDFILLFIQELNSKSCEWWRI